MSVQENRDKAMAFEALLRQHGFGEHFHALKGGLGAVQLNHVRMLKDHARQGPDALAYKLAEIGVGASAPKLAALLSDYVAQGAGLPGKPMPASEAESPSQAWRIGMAGLDVTADEPVDDSDVQAIDQDGEAWPPGMKIVNPEQARSIRAQGLSKGSNGRGYIHLAAEVAPPRMFRGNAKEKQHLLASLKDAATKIRSLAGVRRADVFDAFIVPPGSKQGRAILEEGNHDVHVAEFDVVMLVECESVEVAQQVRQSSTFAAAKRLVDDAASYVHCITAENPIRIDEVDKDRDGVFLFNYFFRPDTEDQKGIDIILGVWEYTAGWWTVKANLTNSAPIIPADGEHSHYNLINHCRWDRLRDVVPALLLRPSLESFVLENFVANQMVAMPILYRLA